MINCVTQIRPTMSWKRLSILESRARKLQKIVHTTIWDMCVRNMKKSDCICVRKFIKFNFPKRFTKQFASKLNLTKVVLQSHHTVFTRNYTMTTILRFADYFHSLMNDNFLHSNVVLNAANNHQTFFLMRHWIRSKTIIILQHSASLSLV